MSAFSPEFSCRQSFEQFEALVEASRGYDTDFRQLGPAQGACFLEQFAAPDMLYMRIRLNNHFHQLGASPAGYRTFSLLANNTQDFRWCGESVTPNTLFVMPASGEFESVSLPGLELFNLSISDELLEQVAHSEFHSSLDALIGSERRLCPQGGENLVEIRTLLCRISAAIAADAHFRPDIEAIWRLAILALGCISGEDAFSPVKPRSKRLATLSTALSIVEDADTKRMRVASLARHCGVSRRTLEHAFQDGLGLSPATYLKARDLRSLRQDLRRASATETSVAELANRNGFTHHGQMAADYRSLFGELPSATLAG